MAAMLPRSARLSVGSAWLLVYGLDEITIEVCLAQASHAAISRILQAFAMAVEETGIGDRAGVTDGQVVEALGRAG
jgi:hypothetical protein